MSYSHDGNGNQTARGGDSFTWDYEDRLTGASTLGSSASYLYRADGLRHSRTIGGWVNTYIWDANRSIPVVVQRGGWSYVHGPAGLISATDGSGNSSYFLSDGLGSTRVLTDSGGVAVAGYRYDAFGSVRGTGA